MCHVCPSAKRTVALTFSITSKLDTTLAEMFEQFQAGHTFDGRISERRNRAHGNIPRRNTVRTGRTDVASWDGVHTSDPRGCHGGVNLLFYLFLYRSVKLNSICLSNVPYPA